MKIYFLILINYLNINIKQTPSQAAKCNSITELDLRKV